MNTDFSPFRSKQDKQKYLYHHQERLKDWPLPYEEQMIVTSYGKTLVRISGPADAPPLILFHGAGTCSLQWLLNIQDLSKEHRTYAIDGLINIGCLGKSIPQKPIQNSDDAIIWMNDLFHALNLKRNVTLLGASHGGWLASQYALHHQDKLEKLILIAPAGIILPFSALYTFHTLLLNILPIRHVYLSFFKWSFQNLWQKDRELFHTIVDDFLLSSLCFEPLRPKELPVINPLTDDELNTIKLPTQILIGKNEVLYSASQALKRIQSLAPQIQIELIQNSGHDLLLTQTELVNKKITDFLRQ